MGKTIAEKIFDAHRVDSLPGGISVLRLDAVFCHEITTPIAINDLVARGKDRVFDPDRIKAVIDHVTPAKDSKTAMQGKIMRDWARRHDIKDFFDIGQNGVCHAIFPEKGFVRPGFTIIMGTLFSALGKGFASLILSFSRQGFFLIPCLIILPGLWGLDGLLFSQTAADIATALLTLFLSVKLIREIQVLQESEEFQHHR